MTFQTTGRLLDYATKRGVLSRFAEHLPITDATPMISLGEGATALVRSTHIEGARGKLAQTAVHGAEIIAIDGNFDAALRVAREITNKHPIALVNSVNPFRIEGQKTASFEIADALGDAPDVLALPVGNAGNITAYWRGFVEYHHAERTSLRPRMLGFQAAGAAPLVAGHPIESPQTIASAIRIGNPASWKSAIEAREASGGAIAAVTDDEIIGAYERLAAEEGIFCEPASAACVAGVLKAAAAGERFGGQRVVCI